MNNTSFGTDLSNAFSPLNNDEYYDHDTQINEPVQTKQQLPQQKPIFSDNNESETHKIKQQNEKLIAIINELKRQKKKSK